MDNALKLSASQMFTDMSLSALILNVCVGFILALILQAHFKRFGKTLTNRGEFAHVFPLVIMTTVLIIAIVKSSLALSLGLVGALSIVRFRTPIKEPEELAYLFISIGTGLGLGANFTFETIAVVILILVLLTGARFFPISKKKQITAMYLMVTVRCPQSNTENEKSLLTKLCETISEQALESNLRRFEHRQDSIDAAFHIEVTDFAALETIVAELNKGFEDAVISFIDEHQIPNA